MADAEIITQGKIALNLIVDNWLIGGIPIDVIEEIFEAYSKDLKIAVEEVESRVIN
jgi:hypothetical protein